MGLLASCSPAKPPAPPPGPAPAPAPGPTASCNSASTPFCDSTIPLPAGWQGHRFKLSQDYPKAAPKDVQPWLAHDFRKDPDGYIRAVLAYFYEGNVRESVDDSFDPALNTARKWYNAPWQDQGVGGREPIHGLTRERVSQPCELDRPQTGLFNNYAVGFYNAPAAVTIGRIWADHGKPNREAGLMPEGTVGAKLLFTTATPKEAPFLEGAPVWNGYVPASPAYNPTPEDLRGPPPARAVLPLRLLQIDIGVKDARSPTGWVFGTFVYGGGPRSGPAKPGGAAQGWTNVEPVGVMWGNDPGYVRKASLKETWLNPKVHMRHYGYEGRLNGPVDNKASSCLSCHATAQSPLVDEMVPRRGEDPSPWLRNVKSGERFRADLGGHALDYSLQLAMGLRNFDEAHAVAQAGDQKRAMLADLAVHNVVQSRGGDNLKATPPAAPASCPASAS